MSIARWGCEDSAVYVFIQEVGHEAGITCHDCPLLKYDDFHTQDIAAMLAHFDEHRERGDVVPESAYDGVREVILNTEAE